MTNQPTIEIPRGPDGVELRLHEEALSLSVPKDLSAWRRESEPVVLVFGHRSLGGQLTVDPKVPDPTWVFVSPTGERHEGKVPEFMAEMVRAVCRYWGGGGVAP